jgi:hypothetical protein
LAISLRDRRIQIAVAVGLAAVAAYNVVRLLDREKPAAISPKEQAPPAESAPEPSTPRWALVAARPDAEWLRNPFSASEAMAMAWPAAAAGGSAGAGGEAADTSAENEEREEITGIGASDAGYFALAGDRILRIGDRIGAGTITEITRDRVVIQGPNGARTIKIE